MTHWRQQPSALVPTHHPVLSWLLTAHTVAVLAWALHDALASRRQAGSGGYAGGQRLA